MGERRRFRDQSVVGIVMHMLAVELGRWQSGGAPTLRQSASDDPGDGAALLHGTPRWKILLVADVCLVAVLITSAVILIVSYRSSGQTSLAIPPTPAPTPVPTVPVPTPPPGVAAITLHTYGAGLSLSQPQEALRSPDGRIVVADTGNHRILILDPRGKITSVITSGDSGALKAPFSLALMANRHLLVLDSDAGRVFEYTLAGKLVRASSANISLDKSRQIAVDASGSVLVADPLANAVYTLGSDLSSVRIQSASVTGQQPLFNQPSAVSAGRDGSIFVVDSQNHRLEQFSSEWQLLQQWSIPVPDTIHSPRATQLQDGSVLASDPATGELLLLGGQSVVQKAFNVPGGAAALPLGIALGGHNDVLVTCTLTGLIFDLRLPGVAL